MSNRLSISLKAYDILMTYEHPYEVSRLICHMWRWICSICHTWCTAIFQGREFASYWVSLIPTRYFTAFGMAISHTLFHADVSFTLFFWWNDHENILWLWYSALHVMHCMIGWLYYCSICYSSQRCVLYVCRDCLVSTYSWF